VRQINASAAAVNHGLIGHSPSIAATRRLIDKAGRNRLPVLLLGESGSGKEVVARAIYNVNTRGQFVTIDCGSLVGTLMESELFGHTKGSFSGAMENKKGLVELADGGTAFLDEIGDLPLEMQVKLLRVIQEKEFRPVGALHWRRTDMRIIAATHRDLKAEVAAGRFRMDLYYRLNVFGIHLAPLRDRPQDIAPLIEHFLDCARADGLADFRPQADTMAAMLAYDWPGNVRELKHCIDRMAAMHSKGCIEDALPSALLDARFAANGRSFSETSEEDLLGEEILARAAPVISIPESERRAIIRALAATQGERGRAAEILGIGRTTLYRKMKQYKLD
jgi:DNA-binding NtrC family response regulator